MNKLILVAIVSSLITLIVTFSGLLIYGYYANWDLPILGQRNEPVIEEKKVVEEEKVDKNKVVEEQKVDKNKVVEEQKVDKNKVISIRRGDSNDFSDIEFVTNNNEKLTSESKFRYITGDDYQLSFETRMESFYIGYKGKNAKYETIQTSLPIDRSDGTLFSWMGVTGGGRFEAPPYEGKIYRFINLDKDNSQKPTEYKYVYSYYDMMLENPMFCTLAEKSEGKSLDYNVCYNNGVALRFDSEDKFPVVILDIQCKVNEIEDVKICDNILRSMRTK